MKFQASNNLHNTHMSHIGCFLKTSKHTSHTVKEISITWKQISGSCQWSFSSTCDQRKWKPSKWILLLWYYCYGFLQLVTNCDVSKSTLVTHKRKSVNSVEVSSIMQLTTCYKKPSIVNILRFPSNMWKNLNSIVSSFPFFLFFFFFKKMLEQQHSKDDDTFKKLQKVKKCSNMLQ